MVLQKQEQTGEETGIRYHYVFPDAKPSGYLSDENEWVYTLGGSPKNDKYMVYTQMDGLPTINVVFYGHSGCPPKLNRNTRRKK